MALILNIDTANETAEISIATNDVVLYALQNETKKNHAAFVHSAINQVTKKIAINLSDIDAIAVAAGPGSYTGIRVGMATAKGLCYALNKPLISLNTLEILTIAVQQQFNYTSQFFYCPMIDARRMEIFTGIYSSVLTPILAPCAMILNSQSFLSFLQLHSIVFFGSGAAKWQTICNQPNASFTAIYNQSNAMAILSYRHFVKQNFANVAYSQPFYLKDFVDSK